MTRPDTPYAAGRSRPALAGVTPALLVAAVVAAVLLGCSDGDRSDAGPATAASATPVSGDPAGPAATTTTEAPPRVRDGDVVDIDELAATMAAAADGDQEWVTVIAELRAASWLASRYPGRYDILDIYSEYWASEAAEANQRAWVEAGLYLDEPLPQIVSVAATPQRGTLVDLDVVMATGEAIVRHEADDAVEDVFDGGLVRGLFTVAPDGDDGGWRIHSIVELQAQGADAAATATADNPESEEPG